MHLGPQPSNVNPTSAERGLIVRALAVAVHTMMRGYSIALGESDKVKANWRDSSSQAASLRQVEDFLAGKMLAPQKQHEAWLAAMTKAGWRYAPKTDVSRRMSNQLLPWAQLPPVHQRRHELWREMATELAIALGLPSNSTELTALYWPEHAGHTVKRVAIDSETGTLQPTPTTLHEPIQLTTYGLLCESCKNFAAFTPGVSEAFVRVWSALPLVDMDLKLAPEMVDTPQ